MAQSYKNSSNDLPQVWLKVTIGGREIPWLTKLTEFLVLPFMKRRAARRRHLWKPEMDRIEGELEAELPGGRSHPEFHDRVLERFSAWLAKHPESAP
jgi:hypothetical protein